MRAARRAFGNIDHTREAARDAFAWRWIDELRQSIRYSARSLRRAPTFSVTAIVILAIGIGMAVAMSTVLHTVLLAPLPVADQDRLVLPRAMLGAFEFWLDLDDVAQLRRQSHTLQAVAGVEYGADAAPEGPVIVGDRTLLLRSVGVTANFFSVLGARPARGRLLQPEDGARGAAPVVVISYKAWMQRFGGDSSILGRRVADAYDPTGYATIVGVAPPGLDYPARTDEWYAIPDGGRRGVRVIGRLAHDATPNAAKAEFLAFVKQVAAARYLPKNASAQLAPGATIQRLADEVLGPVQPAILTLAAAIALLFLIACINVGNLLLLRGAARSHELAIRRAIGASAGDVIGMLLVESAMLAAAGGTLGFLSAKALLRAFVASTSAQIPRVENVGLFGQPTALAVAVTLAAVLLFGVVPAIRTGRQDLGSPLQRGARSAGTTKRGRILNQSLVGAQVALAVVTLASAGVLVRSLEKLQQIPLGYEPQRLSLFRVSFPVARYATLSRVTALVNELTASFKAVPGVTAVTPIEMPPFLGRDVSVTRLVPVGQSLADTSASPIVADEVGGADLLRTFGIRLVRGRGFLESDDERAPNVVIVSRALAERLWPGQDPIGKPVQQIHHRDSVTVRTVIGEVEDTRFRTLRDATPVAYYSWRQYYRGPSGTFAVRTSSVLAAVLPAFARVLEDVDPQLSIWAPSSMDDLIAEQLGRPRLSALLLSAFALIALLLAAIGLYGVIAFRVREQTREIGLRMALGASPRRVRADVLRNAFRVVAIGGLLGLCGSLLSARLLSSLLYHVSSADPVALGAGCGLLAIVALVAAYLPARRATQVDPAIALRSD